jgi:hypothetical protein
MAPGQEARATGARSPGPPPLTLQSDLAPEIFPESREISGFSERGEKGVRYITGAAKLPLFRM